MARFLMCLTICLALPGVLFAEWIMFADKEDTYLYNNQTGEVYIRFKRKKENYKDFFVRMPSGVIPGADGSLKPTQPSSKNTAPSQQTLNQEAARRMTQDALQQVGNLLYQGE